MVIFLEFSFKTSTEPKSISFIPPSTSTIGPFDNAIMFKTWGRPLLLPIIFTDKGKVISPN